MNVIQMIKFEHCIMFQLVCIKKNSVKEIGTRRQNVVWLNYFIYTSVIYKYKKKDWHERTDNMKDNDFRQLIKVSYLGEKYYSVYLKSALI